MALIAEEAAWINVTIPTVRGRGRIERVGCEPDPRGDSRVVIHAVADGEVVLTERTDELHISRFAQLFWVYGVWAAARVVAAGLNRPWPTEN